MQESIDEKDCAKMLEDDIVADLKMMYPES